MHRALVTGGTGFVGAHLVPLLQAKGFQVAVLTTGPGKVPLGVHSYEVDIRNANDVRSALHEFSPNYLYHLAAISSVEASWTSPRLTYEINVFGTLNVFEAAMILPSPPKILHISTAQAYAQNASPLNEASPLGPSNPYAASKVMSEFLSVQFSRFSAGGIVTARSFNHTGPGQSADFVLSSIAKQLVEIEAGSRNPKLSLGNIHVRRDFTDVRDVVQAYCLLLEKGRANETYNVCSGRAWSIKEIVAELERISGINIEIEIDPAKCRAGEAAEVRGDPAKIHAHTRWRPTIPLKVTLHDLLNYWRTEVHNASPGISDGKGIKRPEVVQISE